jgi:hypothetical protein
MKIIDMYQEDGVICMKIESFDRTIYLDGNVDNRALLKAFKAHVEFERQLSRPPVGSIERQFIEQELNEADYWDGDETHHINHGC